MEVNNFLASVFCSESCESTATPRYLNLSHCVLTGSWCILLRYIEIYFKYFIGTYLNLVTFKNTWRKSFQNTTIKVKQVWNLTLELDTLCLIHFEAIHFLIVMLPFLSESYTRQFDPDCQQAVTVITRSLVRLGSALIWLAIWSEFYYCLWKWGLNYFQAIQNKRELYQMDELVQRLSKLTQMVAVEIWIYLKI